MRLYLQALWSSVLDLEGTVCRLLMGQAGSFASFPITFFWISAKTSWMSTDLQREVPLELRELVCDWLQGILHGLTDHISTWYHLLFGSYWFYSKDYTLGYYQLVSAADQGSRMLHLLKFFFLSLSYPTPLCSSMVGSGTERQPERPQYMPWKLGRKQ